MIGLHCSLEALNIYWEKFPIKSLEHFQKLKLPARNSCDAQTIMIQNPTSKHCANCKAGKLDTTIYSLKLLMHS